MGARAPAQKFCPFERLQRSRRLEATLFGVSSPVCRNSRRFRDTLGVRCLLGRGREGRTMASIARRGFISAVALALVLLLPGTVLGASKPIAQFHDHFTDTFSADICGVEVEGVVVVSDNFFLYQDGSFKDAASVRQTFTNPDTGKAVSLSSAGTVTGTDAIIDETAGTVSFVTSFTGLPEKI